MLTLTKAEQIFARRMLPHIKAGGSFEDAARAVLDDDARIFTAFCDRRHAQFVSTADDRGRAYVTREGAGDVIAAEITGRVYDSMRAKATGEA